MSSRPSAYQLTSPGPLRLYSTAELLELPSPEWLIDPILPAGGLCGLYGPPGIGKSFIAVDMALACGAGVAWQQCPTREGYIIYVSAEGGRGMGKRAAAWCLYHNVQPRDVEAAWLVEPIPVYPDSEQMDRLLERITEIDRQPVLIVIDTLARCFDGDENQQEDMGRFIQGCDILRHQLDTTVLIVHHTRLAGDRERGNTAFRGAADTMLALEDSGSHMSLSCSKQKDYEEFPKLSLRLEKVPEADSCVPVLSRGPGRPALTTEEDILRPLRQHGPMTTDVWRSHIPDVPRSTFYRILARLNETHVIVDEHGTYRER